MGKLSLITIALLTLLTVPQAHGGTLLCKKAETNEFFTVIFENTPSQGLATMVGEGGDRSTLQFDEKIETSAVGCFTSEETTKIFFHPYHQIDLKGSRSYGNEGTRCAGSGHGGGLFTGTFSAEMQSPIAFTCDEVSASFRGSGAFIPPTAAAACCSWSEGTLIPGCMPGC